MAEQRRTQESLFLTQAMTVGLVGLACAGISACAASSTSRPNNTPPKTSSVVDKSSEVSTQAAPVSSPKPSAPSTKSTPFVSRNPAPLPDRRCNVAITRGMIGSSKKDGTAMIALAASQENVNGKLVQRTAAADFEWVESFEFTKEGEHKAGRYDFEFRREGGGACPMTIIITDDDIEKAAILYLTITML